MRRISREGTPGVGGPRGYCATHMREGEEAVSVGRGRCAYLSCGLRGGCNFIRNGHEDAIRLNRPNTPFHDEQRHDHHGTPLTPGG